MLLKWPSRISRFLNILPACIACIACKGRIKKLDKACVDLTAFRASVRAEPGTIRGETITTSVIKHKGEDLKVNTLPDSW